jgi:hypothetical protein
MGGENKSDVTAMTLEELTNYLLSRRPGAAAVHVIQVSEADGLVDMEMALASSNVLPREALLRAFISTFDSCTDECKRELAGRGAEPTLLSLQELTRKLAVERRSSIYMVEMRRTMANTIDVKFHGTFDIRTGALTEETALQALTTSLRLSVEKYEGDLRELRAPKFCEMIASVGDAHDGRDRKCGKPATHRVYDEQFPVCTECLGTARQEMSERELRLVTALPQPSPVTKAGTN